jgi:hypothetical protein
MDDIEQRRARRRHRAGKDYRTRDLGNGLVQATPEAVLRAIGSLPPDLGWAAIGDSVLPILPRRRPLPPGAGEPLRVTLPPGIPVGFGIDVGPAYLVVGRSLLASWPVDEPGLVGRALENLRDAMLPVARRDLVQATLAGVPAVILQSGVGCASGLVLLPDELRRIIGDEPRLLLAPMRDLLVALPADTDRALAAWLNEELASLDPNGLALGGFVLEDRSVRYDPLRPPGRCA